MYNRQQTALIVKSFINSTEELPEIHKLLSNYYKLMIKGFDKERRKYINNNSVVIEEPEKMLFAFIILMGFKVRTMNTLGSMVAQELTIKDFEKLNHYLEQMNIPEFKVMDIIHNKTLYEDYTKS